MMAIEGLESVQFQQFQHSGEPFLQENYNFSCKEHQTIGIATSNDTQSLIIKSLCKRENIL